MGGDPQEGSRWRLSGEEHGEDGGEEVGGGLLAVPLGGGGFPGEARVDGWRWV